VTGDADHPPDEHDEQPARLDDSVAALAELMSRRRGGRTVACAESFTAGLLSQALASVEGSGEWFAGGVVTYTTASKRSVLGVRAGSVVSEGCAVQMALGAARLFGTDAAVATTGVAGPSEQDGRAPGTVVIGWCVDGVHGAQLLELPGSPEQVIHRGVRAALTSLSGALTHALDVEH
jgi:PncC family amidohydrolase